MSAPTALGVPSRTAPPVPAAREQYGEVDVRMPIPEGLPVRLRQHRVTLSTLCKVSWSVLLSRYSGDQNIVFGTTVLGRPADLQGSESMIGLFINTLPLRWMCQSRRLFSGGLLTCRACMLPCGATSTVQAVWCICGAGSPGRCPCMTACSYSRTIRAARPRAHPLTRLGFSFSGARTGSALSLIVLAGDVLVVRAVHNRRRIEAAAARTMLEHSWSGW